MTTLVAYPDSDSEQDAHDAHPPKRKRPTPASASCNDLPPPPPLPAAFHDLYSTATRVSTSDDPSLHAGRKRAIPHMEGHWMSHVYLEWHPTAAESSTLASLIAHVQASADAGATIHSSLQTALNTPAPLHISLSRTLPIPTETRAPFLTALNAQIQRTGARPFDIKFGGLKWVSNYDRTRWFLVMGVQKPARDELNALLRACNRTAKTHGFPELYGKDGATSEGEGIDMGLGKLEAADDHSAAFHVSLAWSLEAPGKDARNPLADKVVREWMEDEVLKIAVRFDAVKVKIGNAVHAVDLGKKRESGTKGILG
ncbi:uncharacterized protein K452DRAFT_262903 [Aplosporella prunicola CBS 121167]|uniref:U6 snRNA phosphodiesterase n=1 Tax=Aplosporella prunicola CBS 121167 TaxID=1176127 RepID=A0A6A6BRS0_9PEZI|nr:uncharacterized protein K452DRAFT_262903 [Aplosporella prunicola CBS 121167]KAF2146789.1 hypothetical protein K452DRAFT_262903 [Aplosporella prunicola CBS 121167]